MWSGAAEHLAELYQLAAVTAAAPTGKPLSLALPPSVPTVTPGQASSAVDQAVANAIELIKVCSCASRCTLTASWC